MLLLYTQDFTVEGQPISLACKKTGRVRKISSYCRDVVMKMGVDARDFIINLMPLVLRVSIEVVNIDDGSNGHLEKYKQHYAARTAEFFFELRDTLNLHSTMLSICQKNNHYDILYTRQRTD